VARYLVQLPLQSMNGDIEDIERDRPGEGG